MTTTEPTAQPGTLCQDPEHRHCDHPEGATLWLGGDAWAHPKPDALMLTIEQFTNYPGNPRRGDQDEITASVRDLGFYGLVQAQQSTRHVVVGNHRLRALVELGAVLAPAELLAVSDTVAAAIVARDNYTSDQATNDRGEMIALLSGLEEADQLALVGGLADELAELRRMEERENRRPATDPDDVPEPPRTPITAAGDRWQLGRHVLVCGDATKASTWRHLGVRLADLMFTSFPYGVGLDYGPGITDDYATLVELLAKVPGHMLKATRPGGYIVTNFGDVIAGREIAGVTEPCEFPMAPDYWNAFRAVGLLLHSRRVWAKPHARVAAPWTASSNRAASDWEHLWTWRKVGKHLNERRSPSYLGVWDTSANTGGVEVGKDVHPAAFPTGLAETVLEVHSNPGDMVVDPFGGTGTSLIAAHRTDREAVLFELDPTSCDVICKRFQLHTGVKPERNGQAVDFT